MLFNNLKHNIYMDKFVSILQPQIAMADFDDEIFDEMAAGYNEEDLFLNEVVNDDYELLFIDSFLMQVFDGETARGVMYADA